MVTPENNGFFATGGAYDYWAKTSNFVKGMFAGGGFSLVLSNATNINQIKGDGFTVSGNAAAGVKGFGFSFTPGSNGIYTLTIAIPPMPGLGLGASSSVVDTKTLVTECK